MKETPAQKQARMEAEFKMKGGAFWRFWSWSAGSMPWQREETSSSQQYNTEDFEWPWKGLFGRSSTSELLTIPVPATDVSKVILLTQTSMLHVVHPELLSCVHYLNRLTSTPVPALLDLYDPCLSLFKSPAGATSRFVH